MATHYDRSPHNPNCGILYGRLFVYDFDQAFPDVSDPSLLYSARQSWQVANVDWRDLHVFRPWLQKKGLDKAAIEEAFAHWTDSWWKANEPNIPVEWKSIKDGIWERASGIMPNLGRFIDQVELSLT